MKKVKDAEKKEHLSLEKLKFLSQNDKEHEKYQIVAKPKNPLSDLMQWVRDSFFDALKDQNNLSNFLHSDISVSGQFTDYCKLNNISIKSIYHDNIVSWNFQDQEKFIAQGIFIITRPKLEFLHASFFRKISASSDEEEIVTFNIVSENNYENYIKFRNEYEDWVMNKDRHNYLIRVIDGEDIIYDTEHKWDDLFLPQDIKNEIISSVENFLDNKQFYLDNNIPWKRGILLYGEAGCGKTSIIRTIISNYPFKPITIQPEGDEYSLREAFAYAERQSPSLIFLEDLDSLLASSIDPSTFLNLMDGIASKNGLLIIATANDISQFRPNIIDRPSRFDRKLRIPLPDAKMAFSYLKKWFGTMLPSKTLTEISKIAEKYHFSYAYLKEIYISTMFSAISDNRTQPNIKDIEQTLVRILKDKSISQPAKQISITKYLKEK
jgi:SpoVK/Ycf46/Vps4 family AAA+-type ATPase